MFFRLSFVYISRNIVQEENEMTNQTIITVNTVNDFAEKYPTHAGIRNNTSLWDALQVCALMPAQLNTIILANDRLAIPPAESFFRWWSNYFPWIDQTKLTSFEKKSVGLFWRYIFRDVLHYRKQARQNSSVATIRTATRYELPTRQDSLK